MSVNKVILIGRLGKNPEIKQLPSGDSVANFPLATSEKWRDKSGEKKESKEWHSIVVFGKLADIAGEYLKKGSHVYIEGKIKTRSWEANGEKKYKTEIAVDAKGSLMFLDSKQDQEQEQRPAKREAPKRDFQALQDDFDDDDIPFNQNPFNCRFNAAA